MIWVKLIEVEPYPLEGQNNIQCQTSCPTHAGDKLMRIAVGHIQNIGQYCKPMQYTVYLTGVYSKPRNHYCNNR